MRLQLTSLLFLTILSLSVCAIAVEPRNEVGERAAIRAAVESQLPAPPDGFEWQIYKNVVFAKPVMWNEAEKASSSANIAITVYAASPEEFSQTKQFEMGLTIQIISGSQKIRKIDANTMALLYLKPFIETHKKEEVLLLDQNTNGDFERTYFRFRDEPPGLPPIIVHKFILANNTTDSVHVFTFESPIDSWQKNWDQYGTPIFSKINVLSQISPI